jgi:hypothetical protein
MGINRIELYQHPEEARKFIELIDYNHFGYDLFGHITSVRIK